MTVHREPNMFSWRTKILVGLPLLIAAIILELISPALFISVVGAVTLPIAVGFPLVYMTLPWRDSLLGRALMTHACAVAVLYLVGVTDAYVNLPFHGYLMSFVTAYLCIGLGFQFIVLLRIKYQNAPERNHHDHDAQRSAEARDPMGEGTPG